MCRNAVLFVILAITSGLFSVGCASLPNAYRYQTFYGPADKNGMGNTLSKDGVSYSSFLGSSNTSSDTAYVYSQLGAFEDCSRQKKYTAIFETVNKSASDSYTKVSSYTSYNYHPDGTTTPVSNVYSYPVTITVPLFSTIYTCSNQFRKMQDYGLKIENVGRELVSPYTKDFKGGVLVKEASEKAPFKESDVIINIGDGRVSDVVDYYLAIDRAPIGKAKVKIIRANKLTSVNVTITDETKTLFDKQVISVAIICGSIRDRYANDLKDAGDFEAELNLVKQSNRAALEACDTVEEFIKMNLPKNKGIAI